jgi:hypothetical protein
VKRIIVALASCGVLSLVALGGAGPAAGASFTDCGDTVKEGAGSYKVRAEGIGCAKARRVAKAYFRGNEILGFTCSHTQIGEELSRARCTRSDPAAVVKFLFGA